MRFERKPEGKDRTMVVAEDIKRDVMAQLETALDNPGIKVVAVQRRHYRSARWPVTPSAT